MKMTFFIVTKNDIQTKFMRVVNVFEEGKFIGTINTFEGKFTESIPTVLRNLIKVSPDIVGIIVPNVGAVFIHGYKVLSDGYKFITINSLCKEYSAELTYIK